MGCGCTQKEPKVLASSRDLQRTMKDILAEDEFISVIYHGPNYPHLIPSRAGALRNYSFKHYGVGKEGSRIRAHKDDVNAFPKVYERVVEKVAISKLVASTKPIIEIKKEQVAIEELIESKVEHYHTEDFILYDEEKPKRGKRKKKEEQ